MMKFFGKLIEKKITVIVKEVFDTYNIFSKSALIKESLNINFYVAVVPKYVG